VGPALLGRFKDGEILEGFVRPVAADAFDEKDEGFGEPPVGGRDVGIVSGAAGEGKEPIRIPGNSSAGEPPLLSSFAKRTIPTTTPKRNCHAPVFRDAHKGPSTTSVHLPSQGVSRRVMLEIHQVKHGPPAPQELHGGFSREPDDAWGDGGRQHGKTTTAVACEDPRDNRVSPVLPFLPSDRWRWPGHPRLPPGGKNNCRGGYAFCQEGG